MIWCESLILRRSRVLCSLCPCRKCMNMPKKCPRDSTPRSAPVCMVSLMRMPQCGPAYTPSAPVCSALKSVTSMACFPFWPNELNWVDGVICLCVIDVDMLYPVAPFKKYIHAYRNNVLVDHMVHTWMWHHILLTLKSWNIEYHTMLCSSFSYSSWAILI